MTVTTGAGLVQAGREMFRVWFVAHLMSGKLCQAMVVASCSVRHDEEIIWKLLGEHKSTGPVPSSVLVSVLQQPAEGENGEQQAGNNDHDHYWTGLEMVLKC
ncbi:hypothetical protein E2C01_002204 [Portunus trituberculatus]|uniref:Uncharacterized protein n=1 Tax=Portunus trituberculatus TaxID=210409 RepID=A0A5B7CJS3_PORTR|nr:hypothetical protein [Portunus trituberculatus]